MKKLTKKLSAIMLCTIFAAMQSVVCAEPIDTGLGNGLGGAVIHDYSSGCTGVIIDDNSATLNFTGDSVVNWTTLNLNGDESLNFNAVDGANGITVVNTVTSGMTQIYGQINANEGIGRLIISNPNGLLFDGAKITTAGDTMLTTQPMAAMFDLNGKMYIHYGTGEAVQGVVIKNSDFSIGGEFNILAPSVQIAKSVITANEGLKIVTADGRDYLVAPTTSNDVKHSAVSLESVQINGDVYIASGKDIVKIVNGGEINGNLNIDSDGSVALNYVNNGETLHVTGDVVSHNNGSLAYLRNANVDGNVDMSNGGGFLEIANTNVGGNVNLKTTVDSNTNTKHFIHVVKNNNIKGDLNIDSAHNIHIGGYDDGLTALQPGSLNVGGNINAVSRDGSIAVTIDTKANAVNLEAGLNIISNGKAVITANDYKFKANNYIGGITNEQSIIDAMEHYRALPKVDEKAFIVINGGNVSKIETGKDGYAFIRSLHDMNVTGVNANVVNLAADQADIVIGDNNKANLIQVDGETRNLTVNTPANSRDYTLKYTDIKDNKIITIDSETEITYDMANGVPNGWNYGTQTRDNTYLVVPGPGPDPDPDPVPPDHDNVKVNNVIPLDGLDMNQVATPVAFAADLDDEVDTGVRKNVDGSVTVVRPFTPTK